MGKNSLAIILLGIGAAGIYLGASGNLESMMKGLRGECCGCNADTASAKPKPSDTLLLSNVQIPAAAQAGEAFKAGYYYSAPTGELYLGDNGIY